MCERIYPCLESGHQILRPINGGRATCGCCGRSVAAVVRPDDENRIPRYADHGPRRATTHAELDYQDSLIEARRRGWLVHDKA